MKLALSAIILYASLYIAGFAAEAAPKGALQVEIVPNHSLRGGLRLLNLQRLNQSRLEFDVVLTNLSQGSVTVWERNCSWGFSCLSIELLDNGKRRVIRRKPIPWDSNSPRPFAIPPKGHFIFPVKIGDGTWPADWLDTYLHSNSDQITMRAIYTIEPIEPDSPAQQYAAEIWIGSVAGRF